MASSVSDVPEICYTLNIQQVPDNSLYSPYAQHWTTPRYDSTSYVIINKGPLAPKFVARSGWADYLAALDTSPYPPETYLMTNGGGSSSMPYVYSDTNKRTKVIQPLLMPTTFMSLKGIDEKLQTPFDHLLMRFKDGNANLYLRLLEPVDELKSIYQVVLSEQEAYDVLRQCIDRTAYLHSQGIAGIKEALYVAKRDNAMSVIVLPGINTLYVAGKIEIRVPEEEEGEDTVDRLDDVKTLSRLSQRFVDNHGSVRLRELNRYLRGKADSVDYFLDEIKDYKSINKGKEEFELEDVTEFSREEEDALSFMQNDTYLDMFMVLISLGLSNEINFTNTHSIEETIRSIYNRHLDKTRYIRAPYFHFNGERAFDRENIREYHYTRSLARQSADLINNPSDTVHEEEPFLNPPNLGESYVSSLSVIKAYLPPTRELKNYTSYQPTVSFGFSLPAPVPSDSKVESFLSRSFEQLKNGIVQSYRMPTVNYVVINNTSFKTQDIALVFFDTFLATVVGLLQTEDEAHFNARLTPNDIRLMKELLEGRIMFLTFYKELSDSGLKELGGVSTLLGMYELIPVRHIIDTNFVLGMPFREQMRVRKFLREGEEGDVQYEYLNQRLDAM